MSPLELLFEAPGLPQVPLPPGLRRLYGGDLGFAPGTLYANFVSSLDGVVALEDPSSAGASISGASETDRFVMGLLRAFADAVLIGAGTLRAEPRHLWTPAKIHPAAAADYAELRRQLGRPPEPLLVVVSATGDVPVEAAALEAGALILTSGEAAPAARRRIPATSRIVPIGSGGGFSAAETLAAVRAEGVDVVLTEGGPHLIGTLVAGGFLDELFLTLSPVLAGRDRSRRRMGLLEGFTALPDAGRWGSLLSLRRAASLLFLRYDVGLRRSQNEP
jgi:riboflavin biosynthesis pyrimidine reductase